MSLRFYIVLMIDRYTVEILPYAIRAKGITVLNFAVSLSLIFNQSVIFIHPRLPVAQPFACRYVNPVALAAYVSSFILNRNEVVVILNMISLKDRLEVLCEL